MKVDIYDHMSEKWLNGIIETIQKDDIVKKEYTILVSKEGMPAEFNELIKWPNL
jgi:hypothetical protein